MSLKWIACGVTAAVLALSGCSDVQDAVDSATNNAAAEAIESILSDQLAAHGIELDGPPECDPDLSVEGVGAEGSVDCSARTTEGFEVSATFEGSLDTSGCTGSLVVTVDGDEVLNESNLAGCSI